MRPLALLLTCTLLGVLALLLAPRKQAPLARAYRLAMDAEAD